MDEEERNYCCLVLLLSRVGLVKLRQFFINEWDALGGFDPWTDCNQNGTDLLTKYTSLSYERAKVQSGDTTTWDLSLFVKALLKSKPPFVPKSNTTLVAGLECLKETRNTLCHTGSGKIELTEFTKLYTDACNALLLIGASSVEFNEVKNDVQQPWTEVLSLVKKCASQDTDILNGIDTIKHRLDEVLQNQQQLQQNQEKILHGLDELKQDQQQGQEDIKQGQSGLQQGQEDIKQGQSGLQKGQEDIKQGQSGLQQGQETIKQGQSGLQQGLEELKQEQQQGKEVMKQVQSGLEKGLEELKQGQHQGQEEILKGIHNLQKPSTSKASELSSEDVEEYSIKLKEAITKQADLLPKGPDQSRLKIDDVFTNLTIYHGRKECLQQTAEEDQRKTATDDIFARLAINHRTKKRLQQTTPEDQRPRKMATELKQCSDIFVGENEEDDPKSILVSGEPGIGKTLFSQKIVRDWSTNCISIPNIKFTYLITFRQLVMLGNKELTLRELLNRSPLLNERTMIDEKVMTYIAQHSDQLFIIFDGYDEFKEHSKIFESGQFTNDVETKMPGAALISKLIQKKILCDSVIMITSRPGEADELDKKLHFDRFVNIDGFSESQIIQYVEKYFNSKSEEVKKMAMEKVKGTAHFMSFGRVPLMCFLMCVVIEYEIQNNITRDNSVPLKVTQFYGEVIRCLERNNREIRSLDEEASLLAVEKTLNNFSKLAAQLYQQNRFTFTQKDLEKLKLPENQISYLKSSNLIFCYPVASDSPFPQTTLEYGFAHLTIQEFFVACHLVKKRAMAAQETSEMVHIFTSGLLGLDQENNNDKCMSKVLKSVWKRWGDVWRQRVVLLRCLHEYGLEKEFTRQELTTNRDCRYWGNIGRIRLDGVTDTDCDALAMLLESTATSISSPPHRLHTVLSWFTRVKSSPPQALHIYNSQITITMLNRLLSSLHSNSTITGLWLEGCSLNNDHVKCLCNHLNHTHITSLYLRDNNISDVGVDHIVHSNIASKLTYLNLLDNPVSVEVSKSSTQFCQDNYPVLSFYI